MFDEYNISIYANDRNTKLFDTTGDVRNIDKQLSADGNAIIIDYDLFIPKSDGITKMQYIKLDGYDSSTYRIVKVIPHTNYLELYLAECEAITIA